ncbi:hypothetical protein DERP_001066 [Dermatophagoides pteronyssinus]|uniref:Uncharacterized protein n=1 Tax=Dermatophagoides pteronyssinus TaxID=6956 RepID=A0ABQ8JDF1_DERPT|nr:hypothetical protein DERP_001066 [Dermatophagoides pteronyssinus]
MFLIRISEQFLLFDYFSIHPQWLCFEAPMLITSVFLHRLQQSIPIQQHVVTTQYKIAKVTMIIAETIAVTKSAQNFVHPSDSSSYPVQLKSFPSIFNALNGSNKSS